MYSVISHPYFDGLSWLTHVNTICQRRPDVRTILCITISQIQHGWHPKVTLTIKKLSIDVLWSTSLVVMTNYPGLSHMTKMYTETSDVITTYPSDISTRGKVLTWADQNCLLHIQCVTFVPLKKRMASPSFTYNCSKIFPTQLYSIHYPIDEIKFSSLRI